MKSCQQHASACRADEGTLAPATRWSCRQQGFTLLEAIITVVIIAIVTSIGIMALGNTMRTMHADTGCQATMQVLRLARQYAIDQRVSVRVTFNTPTSGLHSMTTERMVPLAAPILYTQIPLQSDVQFFADPSFPIPPNTPDGIGGGKTAVDFEDGFSPTPVTQVYFLPDGSAQNAAGNTVNGVVYIEQTGYWQGARAVTLFGATGRVRRWQMAPASAGGFAWQTLQ